MVSDALDATNNLYITDYMAITVRKYTPSTFQVTTAISYVVHPKTIAVAPSGEIVIVQEHAILRASGGGATPSGFVGSSVPGYLDGVGGSAQSHRRNPIQHWARAESSPGDLQ